MAPAPSLPPEPSPNSGNHHIPIDFASLNHLPDSYTWFESNSMTATPCTSIPVIDMTATNVVQLVGSACERWGAFQVTNHGVDDGVIAAAEEQARRLFQLPADQKRKAMRTSNEIVGYGAALISPFFNKLMWHEGFTIKGSSAVEHAPRLWPHRYRGFCEAMDNYQKKMKPLAHKILALILNSLGHNIEQDQGVAPANRYLSEEVLQLNSYPSCPNPSRAIGLAPHTDTTLLTILHQDVSGLQIFQEDTGWALVQPIPGALVVNIGDFMHILCNGRFPTVLHRVVPHEVKHRVSIAYLSFPPPDFLVAPLPGLSCPTFRPVEVKEYVDIKYRDLSKALHLIRN